MPADLRLTLQTQAVLGVLLGLDPADEIYGLEIIRTSGLPAGTIYPILGRLERVRWVEHRWEAPEIAQAERRPPRKYYRITPDGRCEAVRSLRQLESQRIKVSELLDSLAPNPIPESA